MRTCLVLLVFACCLELPAQDITGFLPKKVDPTGRYLFYLHGGIVQEQGIHAVSKDFGPYEYLAILDTLRKKGFTVISEPRPKNTDVTIYAGKVAAQVDSLLKAGVRPQNIVVVGASMGAYIAVETAYKLRHREVRYVIIGLCNDYNLKHYAKYTPQLCGKFLSIYEASDQKGSCDALLNEPNCKTGYQEVKLTMGNGHGFLYKPYREWVVPIVKWMEN